MIINWLEKNKNLMNISIEIYDWPNKIELKYFDFGVSLSFEGISVYGRGSDFNQEIALIKATAEAVERWAFNKSKMPNTCGFAAHINLESAKKNARFEIFERDAFFCHYLTKTEWQRQITFSEQARILKSNFLKAGFIIDIGFSEIFQDVFVSLVKCKEIKSKGITISLGCDENLEKATVKSLAEGTQLLSHKIAKLTTSTISFENFKNSLAYTPEHHGMLANNGKYECIYNQAISFSDHLNIKPSYVLTPPNINFEICNIHEAFKPFIVVRAYSDEVQSLFFGNTEEEKINVKRIDTFLKIHNKKPYKFQNLELFPHPLA